MTTAPPKLRWFQFSLRTLLVFVTLCAFACSWLAVKMKQAERQREAVAAIEKLGGTVLYDGQIYANGLVIPHMRPPGPAWLGNMLGNDFFWNVPCVRLSGYHIQVTDAGLEHLKGLSQLRELWLDGTLVTDTGLENLKGLSQLRELWLYDTQATDARLEHLAGLSQLQILNLIGTQVTDAGVKKLHQALPHCEISH